MDGETDLWYKVVRAPPDEEIDWLSPITSSYTLCATKRGKVVCWDVQTDQALAEWNPGEKWELWKCRVEFEQRTVFFTMAKVISGTYTDDRIMEFILMRLTFTDGPSGETSNEPPVFSHVTDFRTSGVVMNVFLLDPSARLLSAFIWVASSNTIGLYILPDWNKPEYVFIDTGIECVMSSNWSCILFENNIVIHCEEADQAFQHFYPLPVLRPVIQNFKTKESAPRLSHGLRPLRTISKKFKFHGLARQIPITPLPLPQPHPLLPLTNGIPINTSSSQPGASTAITITPNVIPVTTLPTPPPTQVNPFPVPPWYPESAHFVRQWWPTLPGIPRVSCTVVLLAATDPITRRTDYVLAQHYFRVPINHAQWFHAESCRCNRFSEQPPHDTLGPGHIRTPGDTPPTCEWAKEVLTPTQKALIAQDEALMNMWYVSAPFDVVRVAESTQAAGEDGQPQPQQDEQEQERPRPLVAVDFGHAVWIEYYDEDPEPEPPGSDAASRVDADGVDGNGEDDLDGGDAANMSTDGGDTEVDEDDHVDLQRLRFVSFPPFRDEFEFMGMSDKDIEAKVGPEEVEGKVRTLEVPDELDLALVETINIDQSQGAVILSDRTGKIFILCYE